MNNLIDGLSMNIEQTNLDKLRSVSYTHLRHVRPLLGAYKARPDEVQQVLLQRQAVFLIESKEKKRHHDDDHADSRRRVPQRPFEQEK